MAADQQDDGQPESDGAVDGAVDGRTGQQVTFLSLVSSTLKAAIGVSDRAARERDFQHHSIAPFIAAGVIFTTLFVLTVVVVVRLVLPG